MLAAFVETAREVFLFCSPTALVLWVVFDTAHLLALFAVLGTLSVYVTAWRLTHEEHDGELSETLAVAWFYNIVVSGAAVLAVRYEGIGLAILLGFPAVATVVRGRVLAAADD